MKSMMMTNTMNLLCYVVKFPFAAAAATTTTTTTMTTTTTTVAT